MSKSTVTRIESGDADPSFATVRTLARAVDCRIVVVGPDRTSVLPLIDGELRDRAGRRYPAHLDVMLPRGWKHGVTPPGRAHFPRRRYFLRRNVRDMRRADGVVDIREASLRGVPAHPPLFTRGRIPRRLRPRLK